VKIIITTVLAILACLLFTHTILLAQKDIPQDQTPQKETNYIEIIKQGYKTAENDQIVTKSWKTGMLNEYKLIFDHLEITYEGIIIITNIDEKTLLCGNLLIIAYGKTLNNNKKRVISLRSICHLFNKEVIQEALIIAEEPNKILNGWDDSILI